MGKILDFLRWNTSVRPTKPSSVARIASTPIELREAHAGMHVTHTVGRPQWPRRDPDVYHRDAYKKLTLIFRSVNMIASALAEAPVRVYRERDGEQETLPDHPLRQIITRPNPLMGEAGLIYNLAVRMCIYGFGALEIERSEAGVPVQLWPLRSDWMRPIPRDQENYDWEYTIPGRKPVTLFSQNVIVVPFAATGDGDPRGIGPLEVAIREYGLLNTMQDYLKGFFDGGALPIYGLLLDPDAELDEDDAELARQRWIEATNWRGGTPPEPPLLESIRDIKRLSFDYNELAYIDLRDVSEIAILQAFGVPGSLVGQRYAQERNTFTNYGEARKSFYQDTMRKLWARIDDALTRSLLPELDPRGDVQMEFDVSDIDALQEDQHQRRTHLLEAARSGMVTRADYRRALGLPVGKHDDVYMVPFNLIETQVGKPMRETVYLAPTALTGGKDETSDEQARARRHRHTRRAEHLQSRNLRIFSLLAERFAPEVQRYLDDQRDQLAAAAFRSTPGAPERRDASDIITVIDWAAEDEKLADVLARIYMASGEQASENAEAETGIPAPIDVWDIANPHLGDVRTMLGERVTNINATTKADIQRIVTESLAEGVSMEQLSERLTGLYDETYRGRSMTIARTESQVSYNEATVINYRQMGFTHVELRDNPNCHSTIGSDGLTCAERHGLVVTLEQARVHIAGEHPNGSLSLRAHDDIYEW